MNMETIFECLVELDLACGFNKNVDDLKRITAILAQDLAGESERTIKEAFAHLRRTCRYWPKVSEILEACDRVRTVDDLPFRQALPQTIAPSTPGMGIVASKFLSKGRSLEEFQGAMGTWQNLNRERQLPKTFEGMMAIANQIFGRREVKRKASVRAMESLARQSFGGA